VLGVIICAKFGVKKLRGLGNTRGQIFEFFLLKWLVNLTTTVLRYRADCDKAAIFGSRIRHATATPIPYF